ncbi:hypothetical protein ACGTN6_09510 [Halomonas sp. THAF12]|uniref:hypothetical protein n=1 Tax=Halomonas sp. B23F22_10 TaxID=3459515 RepID=UPI00373F687B
MLITDGQDNVKVNGLPMARHDSACLINCNASGVGGAPGYLTTLRQTVQSAPGQAGAASDSEPSWNAGQEAGRVISDKWESAKSAARTAWEALPFSSDAATTAAARERVVQGAVDTYRGLDTLTGPSPLDLLDSGIGLATGDAERAARYGEEWQRTADAYGGIKDAVVDAWQEARERNGTLGAIEMSATVFAFELVGPKGSGAAKSAADLAEAAGDVSRRTPDTPSRAPEGDGVHISRNATNHQKGAFGEARAHETMTRNGMTPVGRTDGKYVPGQTGIDGLYRHPDPPPDFVVTEAKFGRARLGKLADGTKQMDDFWVEERLADAVDPKANPALYDELMESWETGRVDKYLVRVKHNGSARVRQLDERARVIGTPKGF